MRFDKIEEFENFRYEGEIFKKFGKNTIRMSRNLIPVSMKDTSLVVAIV